LADAPPDRAFVGQAQSKHGANKFEVLEPARGQLTNEQIMNFKAQCRYSTDTKRLEPALPTLRQGGEFRSDDIDIKTMIASKPGSAAASGLFFGYRSHSWDKRTSAGGRRQ
jgi:hypothetical protein